MYNMNIIETRLSPQHKRIDCRSKQYTINYALPAIRLLLYATENTQRICALKEIQTDIDTFKSLQITFSNSVM